MTTTTITGTANADQMYVFPQIWSGSEIVGYQDYIIEAFTVGVDSILVPFNGGFASLSTVADFQQAIDDIEATGLLGWSAIGTAYAVDGNDVIFSWDGQGTVRIEGLAPLLDTTPEILTDTQGTAGTDIITVTGGGVWNTGYGDDVFYGSDDPAIVNWIAINNDGGSDTIWAGDTDSFIHGADDASESDTVYGEGGADQISTHAGDDFIFAGDGFDTVSSGAGDDVVDLGAGIDEFNWMAGDGHDTVTGGEGRDFYRVFHDTGADKTLTITDLDLRDGSTNGGVQHDVLLLPLNLVTIWDTQSTDIGVIKERQDLDRITDHGGSVTAVGDDLHLIHDDWGTIILEDRAAWEIYG